VRHILIEGEEQMAQPRDLQEADEQWDRIVQGMHKEIDQLRMVAWAAWCELNEIRARDGVPYTHQGYKASVTEDYFSSVVDALVAVLGEDAKPWPAKRWLDQDGSFDLLALTKGRGQ
jgi:hypothetical protein